MGVGEIGEETELLPIGRVQVILWFTLWREGVGWIFTAHSLRLGLNNVTCKVLKDAWRQGRE